MIAALLLGGCILLGLGMVAKYIAELQRAIKQRPTFTIEASSDTRSPPMQSSESVPGHSVPLTSRVGSEFGAHGWPSTELLEFTHDAIIIWEMNGAGILYWNQAAEQLYGYLREEVYGKTTHKLLRTEIAGGTNELEAKIARYGVWVGELRHVTRDGLIVRVQGRLALMAQRDGHWLVLEVNRDMTDQKHAEIAQLQAEEQLANLHARSKTHP